MDKKRMKRIGISFLSAVVLGVFLAAYFIPTELHATYTPTRSVYENDPISEEEFDVYTTSRLGRVKEVEDYSIDADFVDEEGKIQVTSEERKMSTDVDLDVVPVVSSDIVYDTVCYEDHMDRYTPDVSEIIYYEDGSMETVPENQLNVTYEKDERKDTIIITAAGSNNIYRKEFPVITVDSITTKDKVSTEKTLTSDKLDLTIHYSNGRKVKAKKKQIRSRKIKHPKEGTNKLTCYYNGKSYKVKVKAYEPKPTVTFDGYGTFELEYSDYYDVGVSRLNSFDGVTYFDDHRETFYSQNSLPGTGLWIPGRHVADDGTIRDWQGYICAAADPGFKDRYDVILTSLGPAKIYDTGCPYGTIDIYVDW